MRAASRPVPLEERNFPSSRPPVVELDGLRVLVLAPTGRDAALTGDLLKTAGVACELCANITELCAKIEQGAGTALVAEEALTSAAIAALADTLTRQPPWSDFPIVVFGVPRASESSSTFHAATVLGNVTFLDRPVNVRSMLAAVHAALRARTRQYEGRRAIESRDQFLAMLGHELRNPLGAIRVALELLRMKGDDPKQRERHRAVLERQSTHLIRLVDDLLDVARVTYGKVVLQQTEVDLNEVIAAAGQSVEHQASMGRLDFRVSLSREPLVVIGDRVRLDQVIGNLLTNAVKYTPSGGSVRIGVARDGEDAVVRVTDSGVGIDPKMLGRVFDLFAQADRSLERAQGGLGLGLTLVRSLVRLHGGEVEAYSEGLGHGSEFVMRLPLACPEEADEHSDTGEFEVKVPRRRFVYVEDSEDLREMMTELLESQGHEVNVADNGPDGVQSIISLRPEIALVDIGLPGFDGFEVARRVREAGVKDVLLIAVSGYGQPDDRRRSLEAGFDDHLTKPVALDAVNAALDRARAAPAD